MKLFSHRYGFKPIKDRIQIDNMDGDLRNGLWNALKIFYWDYAYNGLVYEIKTEGSSEEKAVISLIERIWHSYYKIPLDNIPVIWSSIYTKIREDFFEFKWFEVYDFIQFIANNYPEQNIPLNKKFMEFCNSVLERELSAYRFVGGKITQITSETEIVEIEETLKVSEPYKPVKIHIQSALDLLADRKSPDYRNSIKESISAVEAICKIITNNKKLTLGDALKVIQKENKVVIHPALSVAFSNLYGYTSGTNGIRHALLDEPDLNFEDAKFMLVSCTGFINYLIVKSSKV